MARDYSLTELRECAERELRLRKRVYPGRVERGRMSPQQANLQIQLMEAIVAYFADAEQLERLL